MIRAASRVAALKIRQWNMFFPNCFFLNRWRVERCSSEGTASPSIPPSGGGGVLSIGTAIRVLTLAVQLRVFKVSLVLKHLDFL